MKMEPKATERSATWNLTNESDQHVKQLEESIHQEDNVVTALDTKMFSCKKEIKDLQKKVQEAEIEKTNI